MSKLILLGIEPKVLLENLPADQEPFTNKISMPTGDEKAVAIEIYSGMIQLRKF